MAINQYTHDLFGREVDSSDCSCWKKDFGILPVNTVLDGENARQRSLIGLAKTAADVPVHSCQEWQDCGRVDNPDSPAN